MTTLTNETLDTRFYAVRTSLCSVSFFRGNQTVTCLVVSSSLMSLFSLSSRIL